MQISYSSFFNQAVQSLIYSNIDGNSKQEIELNTEYS